MFDWSSCEKGHGRVEERLYQGYELPLWHLEDCWSKTGLQTVVWVDRSRYRTKDGQTTQASCCFVRNRSLIGLGGQALAGSIRNHWRIESDHPVLDTTAGEDALRCGHSIRMRSLASVLNAGVNLLRGIDRGGNLWAYWKDCSADRKNVIDCWRRA